MGRSLPLLLLLLTVSETMPFDDGVRPDDLLLTVTPGTWSVGETEMEGRRFRRITASHPGRRSEAGRPELPFRTFLVGLPEGYGITASIESETAVDHPGLPIVPAGKDTLAGPDHLPLIIPFIDDRFYSSSGWYPADRVDLGRPLRFRHQRVVPVRVSTFRTNPASGLLRVYEKQVIRIRFEPEPGRGSESLSRESTGSDPRFENLYRGTLANYEEAKRFRTRPRRPTRLNRSFRKRGAVEYKIRVADSGLYRIDSEELTAAGLDGEVGTADIAIARRGFSDEKLLAGEDPFTEVFLPLLVEDGDGDGLFESGDALFAWLPGFREDRMERDFEDRFETGNAFFLTTTGGSPPLEEREASLGFGGLDPLPSFPDSVRWEIDLTYDIGPVRDTTDLYFPYSKLQGTGEIEMEIPPPDRGSPFRVKAMTVSTLSSSSYHRYVLLHEESGDTLFNELVYGTVPALRKSDLSNPGSLLSEGVNRFTYRGSRGNSPDNTYISGAGGFFDWFEIHGSFLYEATGDYIRFSSGEARGKTRIDADRFSSSDILLLDVTDPFSPVRIAADPFLSEGDTLFTITFQDSVSATRSYAAATREGARRIKEGSIEAVEPAALPFDEGDYVIIAWDDFLDPVEPLALHRESEGFQVVRTPLGAVYDRFAGGLKDPKAIGRYLRYAFERWETPPVYVLLVGDGYEDYKGVAGNREENEFDFLPAYPLWENHLHDGGDRWTASDQWFVMLGGEGDYLPEMLIGRFPAGNAGEAASMTEKTILYETTGRNEPWRRRALFVADDAWTFSYGPIRNSYQTTFESGSRGLAARVAGNSVIRADTLSLWLSTYTDVYHPLCPYRDGSNPNEADLLCVLDLVRDPEEGITTRFFDLLNDGAFLVNFQGHGSRSSLTHELFLVEGMSYRGWKETDITDRTEPGTTPYIFMGYGCAISEFDRFKTFGNDAVGERMVLLEGGGAVLTYGSTAIEFLGANLRLNDYILDRFYPPPGESLSSIAGPIDERRIAEVLTAGMADYAAANYAWATSRRYVILGDPALRIGPWEPDFSVAVDGETIEDGAVRIPRAGGAPLLIEGFFRSDLLVEEEDLLLFADGEPIDDSLFTVEAGIDSGSGRWLWTITYEHVGGSGTEEILLQATDGGGRSFTRSVRTGFEVDLSFDGVAHTGSLAVRPVSTLRIDIPARLSIDRSEIRVVGEGFSAEADTLYSTSDSTMAAEIELFLPEGSQTIELSVGGLAWSVPLEVAKSVIEITATVDGEEAESGHHLLGHRDGSPPRIVALIEDPRDLVLGPIRLIDGEDTLASGDYDIARDTIGLKTFYRLTYRPDLRNEEYQIRIEASEEGGETVRFLLRVSLPITLYLGGAAVEEGDYAAPACRAKAVALFPDSLPDEEVLFFLDGIPVDVDTLRREGGDRWIATALIEAGGGSHTILFRAGAFSASTTFRVEERLRIVEPLVYPNPVGEGWAGFVYQLTSPADEVRVEIFTVAGRRIRVIEGLSGKTGYNENELAWDGRDQDGDRLARGVYPFRIIASRNGERAEEIGRIVIRH